jgi:hypothetical protein
MNNLMLFEEFVGTKIKKFASKVKDYFKEECPKCKSKDVEDAYSPGMHEMTCKKCGCKWKTPSNEAGW